MRDDTASTGTGPKRRKHHSYDESVDESAGLIDKETTDVEHAVPADGNEPMETVEKPPPEPPAFEE
jgi:hypothetical protein